MIGKFKSKTIREESSSTLEPKMETIKHVEFKQSHIIQMIIYKKFLMALVMLEKLKK